MSVTTNKNQEMVVNLRSGVVILSNKHDNEAPMRDADIAEIEKVFKGAESVRAHFKKSAMMSVIDNIMVRYNDGRTEERKPGRDESVELLRIRNKFFKEDNKLVSAKPFASKTESDYDNIRVFGMVRDSTGKTREFTLKEERDIKALAKELRREQKSSDYWIVDPMLWPDIEKDLMWLLRFLDSEDRSLPWSYTEKDLRRFLRFLEGDDN